RHRLARSPDPTGAPSQPKRGGCSKRLVRMVPGSARNWIAVHAVHNSTSTQTRQKEKTSMKTKLLKTIASSLLLACALVGLVAAMTLGTPRTAQAAAGAPVCSVGMLNGLYLWTFDGYQNVGGNLLPKAVMQGTRFHGDATTFNAVGTVNIGCYSIIDATGGVGTYTVKADCTGTISIANGPSFNMY